MFEPTHMAVGALCQSGLKRRLLVAIVAFTSHAILDSTNFWHRPYPWPAHSPVILHFLPYPHNLPSILTLIVLVMATFAVGFLLRRYWWGMLWAISPDLVDWLLLYPITGEKPIHDLFSKVSTPWGFGLEMSFIFFILLVVITKTRLSYHRAETRDLPPINDTDYNLIKRRDKRSKTHTQQTRSLISSAKQKSY